MLYNIGIYLRVSKEDENSQNESNSITNQRQYIYNYILSNNLKYYKILEYEDDGKTATNFMRKGIIRLLNDVNNKKINCIIVKDLSRFGRNYIETSQYLENIFPVLNVRFISINDNYDSNNEITYNNYFNLNFKNILYNYYSKDLSKKVKTTQLNNAKIGKIPTSSAPYGYIISSEDKHKFEIDENVSDIVKKIFNMACEGKSFTQIAKFLNENKIETPLEYKINSGKINKLGRCKGKLFWKSVTVRNILKNEVYIGKRVYGKTEIKEVGSKNYINIDKENWIIFENHHLPIISKNTFYEAQKIFKNPKIKCKSNDNIFKNTLKCGYCNYYLQRINKKDIKYKCSTLRYTNKYNCKDFIIKESEIKEIIFKYILYRANLVEYNKVFKNIIIKKYEKELQQIKNIKDNLYDKYLKENLTREIYMQKKQEFNKKEEALKKNINDNFENLIYSNLNNENSNKFIKTFVKEIRVFEEKIEIEFNFYDSLNL
ncbi:recombinase family protein [[Clostridium] colinum]|uniref:recombinase family protein n=1 Tax=[Clostridium] colinum TaxID=36835 RepID=UPI00202558C9|nr:recombinase family protein [[Clostridium] colinum]